MSETSKDISGPDYFGFYSREITELFAPGEDALTFPPKSLDLARKLLQVAGKDKQTQNKLSADVLEHKYETAGAAPLFSDTIGSQLSEFRKERLKSLVRRWLFTFTEEVDSVLDAVLGICRVQSVLRYKASLLNIPDAEKDAHNEPHQKKQKVLDSFSMDDDLRLLLDNENSKVEEMVKKHSAQLFAKIESMNQKLEEFLDLLLSNFRLMNLKEKQKLQKLIQSLPPTNLDHVVEIIRHDGPFSEEIHVDLEQQSKASLWRLYYYVGAVENARKLCEVQ